tara:strand:- start:18 stop:464 length:447 start_codon:yes stop_codon:yes gene_type:complete
MDSIVSRFEKHIDKSGDCWLWTGSCNKDGYGRFTYEEKKWIAHRFSYYLANGELPEPPLIIRHKCRSRNCVNPDHLESGTSKQNQADKVRDGTDNRGEKCWQAKLTEVQVLEIRSRSTENQKDLGKEFGVRKQTISYIIHKKNWAWLE